MTLGYGAPAWFRRWMGCDVRRYLEVKNKWGGVVEVRMSVGWTSGEMGLSWEYLGECWEYLGEQTFAPKRLTSGRLRSAASANGWPGPYGLAPPPGWRLGRIGEKGVPAKIRQ